MEELNNLLDISSSKKSVILHKLLDLDDKELKNNIDISNNVYNDIKIDDWVSKLSDLEGTSIVLMSRAVEIACIAVARTRSG